MKILTFILLALLLLPGCSAVTSVEPIRRTDDRPYFSEINLPEAKAWYGYAQFRMLIVDSRWDEAIEALKRAVAFDPKSAKLKMTLAKAYLHNQQLEEGERVLEQLVARDEDHQEAWELLGELHSYRLRFAEAESDYRMALQLDPQNEGLWLRLVVTLEQQGQLDKAMAELRRLLEAIPDSVPARLALARLQRHNPEAGTAIKTYRELLELRPGQPQAILELGQLLEKDRQVNEAIDLYREALQGNPELLSVYKQLARILILQERYEEALSLLRQAHRQRPDDSQILTRIGLLYLSQEDFEHGEESFRRVLEIEPESPHGLYSLGMALIGQHRDAEALEVLEAISPESEVFPDAVLQIGYLYRQEGDLERGIAVMQQAIDNERDSAELYYYLSAFLGEAERLATAGKVVRQGLVKYPQDTRLIYQLGIVYERLDDREQALQQMEKVLEFEPLNADALNFIAYHFAEKGENLEQALAQAQKALEQKQTSYILDTLGWVYYRLQRYDDARANIEKAIQLEGEDPLIYEHLGDIYQKQDLWRDAEKAYRRALELDPESESAARKLQQLLEDHPQ